MRTRPLLAGLTVLLLALPLPAGPIFGGKKKPTPQERVPQLLQTVRADGDEDKRVDATEELRQFDPAAYPDIVPTLLHALAHDAKPRVRAEAAATLARFRPVSGPVGQALENALANDSSMRVRMQARSALLSYNWAGYRRAGKDDPLAPPKDPVPPPAIDRSKEPPLADPTGGAPPAAIPGVPNPLPMPPVIQTTPGTKVMPVGPTAPPPTSPPQPPAPGPALVPVKAPEPKGPDL